MADDLARLRDALAARMQQIGIAPDDPRVVPLFAQVQAMLQRGPGGAANAATPAAARRDDAGGPPASASLAALPPGLQVLVEDYLRISQDQRARAAGGSGLSFSFMQAPALAQSEAGRALLELSPAEKAAVVVAAYAAWANERNRGPNGGALRRVVSDLLRAKLEFTEAQAIELVRAAVRDGFAYSSHSPNLAVAGVLKRHVDTNGLGVGMRETLTGLRGRMVHTAASGNAEGRKLLVIVDAMLAHAGDAAGGEPRFTPKDDAWGRAVAARLVALPSEVCARLTHLLALAAQGGGNAKPAKGWLKAAEQELAVGQRARDGALLLDIIELYEPGAPLTTENQNTLRALIWLAAMAAPADAPRRLEAYAQRCLTFSSAHFAYLSLVLGNAAVHAFSLLPGTTGVGSLSRLKLRLKRPGEVKAVEKALAALAEARGMTSGELDEIGLPDYGFDADGTLEVTVGPATAVLAVTDANTLETTWRSADGKALSGTPTAVKEGHAEALKALKARAKEIAETLAAQRLRLERLYLGDREWPLAVWRRRYLDAPLVANLARRLIWSIRIGEQWVPALLHDGVARDAAGNPLDGVGDEARLRLWHPMQSDTGQVLAWRRQLQALGITQPFKQAHREIYVLTDAERATGTWSNRFAAHILDQNRFRALGQARGWNCPAIGEWDGGGAVPHKKVADLGLQVEFWVEPVESSTDPENYRFRQLSTDRVRFVSFAREPIPLDAIDPVVFSELMRDVDLFVGVAGIGNDPTWPERDNDFGDYWSRAAFGDLSEGGQSRRAVLADILPGLAIAPRCRLEDRYLVVEGKLRSYRIHLGSGNIQMDPNNQYLCIVPDRPNAGARVRLPFEGDTTLSVILSKAFLLAADDEIKDPAIRRQIQPDR
jgi:hypothetical protein